MINGYNVNKEYYCKMMHRISKNLDIFKMPVYAGQSKYGVKHGPSKILSHIKPYLHQNVQIYEIDNNIVSNVGITTHNLYSQMQKNPFHKKLVLGGDHSLALGSIASFKKTHPDGLILWIDAHADINTPCTSLSGNLHGMPLAFLTGLCEDLTNEYNLQWLKKCLPFEDLVYIGIRDLDQSEEIFIEKHKILYYTNKDVETRTIENIMHEIYAKKDPHMSRPIYVSFDIDGLDKKHCPSTGTVVDNGLSLKNGIDAMNILSNHPYFMGMDIAEFNPELGNKKDVDTTINSITDILHSSKFFI